jgi:uncharacterized membrane protein YagU involved in acid resistance
VSARDPRRGPFALARGRPSASAQGSLGGAVAWGTVAGLLATAPMTLAMEVLHRRLPPPERHPLPPRTITMRVAGRARQRHRLDRRQRRGATLVAHFAYGAAAGGVYAPLARLLRLPAAGGLGFGLLVWAISYLGLLPAAGLFPPPHRETPRRTALMIAAHLVWGASLGVLSGTA